MTTVATDTPDGERLARVEVRLDSLDQQCSDIRAYIREQRAEIRELRAEMQESFWAHQAEMRDIRSDANKKLLWMLGIIITMWISLVTIWGTFMFIPLNKLGG